VCFGWGGGVVATVVIGKETVGVVANLLRHLPVCCSRLGALANTLRSFSSAILFQQFSGSELVVWAKWLIREIVGAARLGGSAMKHY